MFLRMIEYYEGILILTTNRDFDFDEAFRTRVHITINYPKLGEAARTSIWQNLVRANKHVGFDESWNPDAYSALAKLEINVRNVLLHMKLVLTFFLNRVASSRIYCEQQHVMHNRSVNRWASTTSIVCSRSICRSSCVLRKKRHWKN